MEHSEIVVLIVDDDPILRGFLCAMIQEQGYSFLVGANGEEALALSRARRGEIHLLVSDVDMPYMNGLDLATQIMQERPAIRILLTSGTDSGIKQAHVNLPFLKKPFVPDELLQKLEEVLSGPDAKELTSG